MDQIGWGPFFQDDQIFGNQLSMGTEFDGDRLSSGIYFMGIICLGKWGTRSLGINLVWDQMWRTLLGYTKLSKFLPKRKKFFFKLRRVVTKIGLKKEDKKWNYKTTSSPNPILLCICNKKSQKYLNDFYIRIQIVNSNLDIFVKPKSSISKKIIISFNSGHF